MSGAEGNTGMRAGRGFRRASESARGSLRHAAGRYGFAEVDVLARWPEVVGEALSGICHPLRVSYGRSRALGATLFVAAEGACAPEVEMQAPRIIERVNSFYGYRAIARLKVRQTGAPAAPPTGLAEAPPAFRGPEADAAPDSAAAGRARDMAGGARDPALRAALTRLGAYVLARSQGPKA